MFGDAANTGEGMHPLRILTGAMGEDIDPAQALCFAFGNVARGGSLRRDPIYISDGPSHAEICCGSVLRQVTRYITRQ